MSFVACSSNEDDVVEQMVQPQDKMMTITASMGDEDITRTALSSDKSVVWSQGDVITIGGKEFTLVDGASTTEGKFKGPVLPAGTYEVYYGVQSNYIPSIQIYEEGKISNAPMRATLTVDAQGNPGSMQFKNLCGLVHLSLKGSPEHSVRSIRIKAGNNLSGSFKLSDSGAAVVTTATDGSELIALDCGEGGVQLSSEGRDFYIAMVQNLTGHTGVSIEIVGTQGESYKKSFNGNNGKFVVGRAKITNVAFEFSPTDFVAESHEGVDLGLSSGKIWAAKNIGANGELAPGDYFAWGEITSKNNYTWSTYAWGTQNSISKYNASDKKLVLSSEDDAAIANWGNGWRMPTAADFQELINECTIEWTATTVANDGFLGLGATSATNGYFEFKKNGKSLKLPAVGFYDGAVLQTGTSGGGVYLRYWTTDIADSKDNGKVILLQGTNIKQIGSYARYIGLPIRPIKYPTSSAK